MAVGETRFGFLFFDWRFLPLKNSVGLSQSGCGLRIAIANGTHVRVASSLKLRLVGPFSAKRTTVVCTAQIPYTVTVTTVLLSQSGSRTWFPQLADFEFLRAMFFIIAASLPQPATKIEIIKRTGGDTVYIVQVWVDNSAVQNHESFGVSVNPRTTI